MYITEKLLQEEINCIVLYSLSASLSRIAEQKTMQYRPNRQPSLVCHITSKQHTRPRLKPITCSNHIWMPLRDSLSFVKHLEKFLNSHIRPLWYQAWTAKEEASCTCITHTTESIKAHLCPLPHCQ